MTGVQTCALPIYGFAGETTRAVMLPEFRDGRYGAGLVMGVRRLVARIAEVRQVTLPELGPPSRTRTTGDGVPLWVIIVVFLLFVLISRAGGGPGRSVRRWGRGGWSGWSSGVGPFGGGWTGGSTGGFGGGFGGGFDPLAIAANPQGFQQMLQMAQQREQQIPGSTFLSQMGFSGVNPDQMYNQPLPA